MVKKYILKMILSDLAAAVLKVDQLDEAALHRLET